MPENYVVKQGDSISSIAYRHDLFPETIWDHPRNAELKKEREDQYVLLPGDEVFIPDKRVKEEECDTEKTHRFRRNGVPEKLRVRFLDEDENPRQGIPYILSITTRTGRPVPLKEGQTDPDGFLEVTIPPDASRGELLLGEGEDQETIELALGHVDPLETISGVQSRLNNLGYHCGKEDGVLGEQTRAAVQLFQDDHDLDELEEGDETIDQDTLQDIENRYSGA